MVKNNLFNEFEAIAYSCNALAYRSIQDIFDRFGILTFQFVEYFLEEPIKRGSGSFEGKLYFPFLRRYIETFPYAISILDKNPSNICLMPKTDSNIESALELLKTPYTFSSENSEKSISFLKEWAENELKYSSSCHLEEINILELFRSTDDAYQVSYCYLAGTWLLLKNKTIFEIKIPIETGNCLYGYFLVIFPYEKSMENNLTSLVSSISEVLFTLAEKLYVPTLIFYKHKRIEKKFKLINDCKVLKEFKEHKVWEDSDNMLESSLYKLTHKRVEVAANDESVLKKIQSNCFFAKYDIVAPSMVQIIQKIIGSCKHIKTPNQGDSLPSALIYGEAGSGKDIMAKLIALFSEDFFAKEIKTINMSAYKPNILAIPILHGLDINGLDKEGLLSSKDPQVLIMDELNSFDYDLQGSLLRVIENGEINQLFGKSNFIQSLIIGIVNEDPDIITHEEEITSISTNEGLLGKIISSYLLDSIGRTRKLRADLKYRLMRNLYIKLPSLRDRREDIPILFYNFCSRYYSVLSEENDINIDLDFKVYELLIRPDLTWPGNVRQLQAIANEVCENIVITKDKKVKISHRDVMNVIKSEQHFGYLLK